VKQPGRLRPPAVLVDEPHWAKAQSGALRNFSLPVIWRNRPLVTSPAELLLCGGPVALLPSKETLSGNYRALCERIDQIVD
jgi:hypothetical protein